MKTTLLYFIHFLKILTTTVSKNMKKGGARVKATLPKF